MVAHVIGTTARRRNHSRWWMPISGCSGAGAQCSFADAGAAGGGAITVTPTMVAIQHLDGWFGPAAFRLHGSVTMADGKAYSNVTLAMSLERRSRNRVGRTGGEEFVPEMDGTIRLRAAT